MTTPFFPQFRPRLAAMRRATARKVQQASLAQLEHYLEGVFPLYLLAQEDEKDNSRERIFTLLLTFECFLWQALKPKTACRVSRVKLLHCHIRGGAFLFASSLPGLQPHAGTPPCSQAQSRRDPLHRQRRLPPQPRCQPQLASLALMPPPPTPIPSNPEPSVLPR